jgi:hypothetical protein
MAVFLPAVLGISDVFLLLRIDRDHRIACRSSSNDFIRKIRSSILPPPYNNGWSLPSQARSACLANSYGKP